MTTTIRARRTVSRLLIALFVMATILVCIWAEALVFGVGTP